MALWALMHINEIGCYHIATVTTVHSIPPSCITSYKSCPVDKSVADPAAGWERGPIKHEIYVAAEECLP